MVFLEQLFLSFKYYGETFRFIDRHNLYGLFILPAILSLGTTLFIGWLAWKTGEEVIIYLFSFFNFRELSGFWGEMLEFIFRMVIRVLTVIFYLKVFRYSLLLVLTPSLMWISRRIQSIALGQAPEISLNLWVRNIFRSMKIAILNFVFDIFATGLILLIVIILTWLAPLAAFAIFFEESYFLGYAMIYYRNQFLNLSVKESRTIIQRNMGLALGNGICFNIVLLIPLIGVMTAAVLALIAAGISIDEVEKRNNHAHPIHQPL